MPRLTTEEQKKQIRELLKGYKSLTEIARITGCHYKTVQRVHDSCGVERGSAKVSVGELRGFLRTIQEAFEDLEKAGHLEADDREENDKIIDYLRKLADKAYYIDKAYVNVLGAPVKPDLTPAFKVAKPKMTQHHHVLGGSNV